MEIRDDINVYYKNVINIIYIDKCYKFWLEKCYFFKIYEKFGLFNIDIFIEYISIVIFFINSEFFFVLLLLFKVVLFFFWCFCLGSLLLKYLKLNWRLEKVSIYILFVLKWMIKYDIIYYIFEY